MRDWFASLYVPEADTGKLLMWRHSGENRQVPAITHYTGRVIYRSARLSEGS